MNSISNLHQGIHIKPKRSKNKDGISVIRNQRHKILKYYSSSKTEQRWLSIYNKLKYTSWFKVFHSKMYKIIFKLIHIHRSGRDYLQNNSKMVKEQYIPWHLLCLCGWNVSDNSSNGFICAWNLKQNPNPDNGPISLVLIDFIGLRFCQSCTKTGYSRNKICLSMMSMVIRITWGGFLSKSLCTSRSNK